MPTRLQIVEGCAECGIIAFRSRSGRVSHCKSIHGQQIAEPIEPLIIGRLKCPHCPETFAKGSGLSSHLGWHGRHVGSGAGLDDRGAGAGIDAEHLDGDYRANDGAFDGDYIVAEEDASSSSSSSRNSASSGSASARHGSGSGASSGSSNSSIAGTSDSDESSRHLFSEEDEEEEDNSSEDFVCEADEALFPDISNAETRCAGWSAGLAGWAGGWQWTNDVRAATDSRADLSMRLINLTSSASALLPPSWSDYFLCVCLCLRLARPGPAGLHVDWSLLHSAGLMHYTRSAQI